MSRLDLPTEFDTFMLPTLKTGHKTKDAEIESYPLASTNLATILTTRL